MKKKTKVTICVIAIAIGIAVILGNLTILALERIYKFQEYFPLKEFSFVMVRITGGYVGIISYLATFYLFPKDWIIRQINKTEKSLGEKSVKLEIKRKKAPIKDYIVYAGLCLGSGYIVMLLFWLIFQDFRTGLSFGLAYAELGFLLICIITRDHKGD